MRALQAMLSPAAGKKLSRRALWRTRGVYKKLQRRSRTLAGKVRPSQVVGLSGLPAKSLRGQAKARRLRAARRKQLARHAALRKAR